MFDISQSIYELGKRLGVTFHFNQRVEEIVREDGRVTGVNVAGDFHPADTVVCNMDVWLAYDKLLPGAKKPKRTLSQQKSTSAVIFYWGVKQAFPELGVHNIFFSEDYREEFAKLEAGELGDDVTVYVNVSSKVVSQDAPQGCENWFVMVNAPAAKGQDWDAIIPRLRERVIALLEKHFPAPAAPPKRENNRQKSTFSEELIVEERIITPPEIERLTGSHQGALYGTSSNNTMAAFLRHPNFSHRIGGLYFLGGSVHPGGGVPLCLLSARITADLIDGVD
jgi:phytoene dehydrogenase-like protein